MSLFAYVSVPFYQNCENIVKRHRPRKFTILRYGYMAAVLIKCFVWASGRNLVEDWLEEQRGDARAEFLNIMTALRDQPRSEWTRPDYGVLRRECRGLGEVRFKVRNVEHRPLGFFIGDDVFVLVAFATERDGKFEPRKICKTAQNRKTCAQRNPRRTRACNF